MNWLKAILVSNLKTPFPLLNYLPGYNGRSILYGIIYTISPILSPKSRQWIDSYTDSIEFRKSGSLKMEQMLLWHHVKKHIDLEDWSNYKNMFVFFLRTIRNILVPKKFKNDCFQAKNVTSSYRFGHKIVNVWSGNSNFLAN